MQFSNVASYQVRKYNSKIIVETTITDRRLHASFGRASGYECGSDSAAIVVIGVDELTDLT